MRKNTLSIGTFLIALAFLNAGGAWSDTIVPGGTINNETWTKAGSPYLVQGNVSVGTLTIQSGVRVVFDGDYEFTVTHMLTAIGADTDSIYFQAVHPDSVWGGIHLESVDPSTRMSYCLIQHSSGSGLRITNSPIFIDHCGISDNTADEGGGLSVTMDAEEGELRFENCVIASNRSTGNAGGIRANMETGSLFMQDCVITGNTASDSTTMNSSNGGGLHVSGSGGVFLKRCQVSNNRANGNCNTGGCSAYGRGGGIYAGGILTLENCEIKGNKAWARESEFHDAWYEHVEYAYGYGGGIHVYNGTLLAVACVISNNATTVASANNPYERGSGVYLESGSAELVNCTIAYNDDEGLRRADGPLKVTNSIVYNHDEYEIVGTATVTYSLVEGDHSGEGNIDSLPDFTSLTDLRIKESSPCVDAGNPHPDYDDLCFPPSYGTERNDMGAYGGPEACGWIICPPEGPPAAPTGISATGDSDFVTLSWHENCEPDLDEYRIFRGTGANPTTQIASVAAGTTEYVDEAVTVGTKYYYRLKAHDSEDLLSGYSAQVFATPGPRPSSPEGLTAEGGDERVTLTWDANPAGETVASYRVYRGVVSNPTTEIASVSAGSDTTLTYTDTGLENGTTYHYRVTAVNDAGIEGDFSEDVPATPGDYAPPSSPTDLSAAAGNARVTLTWDSNNESDLAGYLLYRGSTPSPTAVIDTIAPSEEATVTYEDTTVVNGNTYYYRLKAFDTQANLSGYSFQVSATPQGIADLSVVKIVDDASPDVGGLVTYTVTVTNHGPEHATGVQVRDELPDGLTPTGSWPPGGTTYTGGVWNVGALSNGVSLALTIQASVDRSGTIVNRAEVIASNQTDEDASNDADSVSVSGLLADLAVSKTVDRESPAVGDTVVYTVALENEGPSGATGVTVADGPPAGITFLSHTATAGTYDGSVWTVGSVAEGARDTLLVRALVQSSGSHINTASIASSDRHDPNVGNDVSSVTVSDSLADLALLLQVDEDRPNVRDTITLTLRIDNNGPWQATGIEVLCGKPSGLTFLDAEPSIGTYGSGIWYLSGLSSGAGATLTIQATVDVRSSIVQTATITRSGLADAVTSNNQSSVTVSVNASPSIALSPPTAPNAGDPMVVVAMITDDGGIQSACIRYRLGGCTEWSEAVMSPVSGSQYQGTVPADSVTARGLAFYIRAEDGDGAIRESGVHHMKVNVTDLRNPKVQASGPDAEDYRLVSVPIDLVDPDPGAVLIDDFGEADTTRWRLFGLTVGQEYVEYPNTEDFEPGRAFWFATNLTNRHLTTGSGTSLRLDEESSINLVPGWNFVGSPFDFPIPADRARLESGGALEFEEFETEWGAFDDTLRPFEGYAVYAGADDRLIICPDCRPGMDVGKIETAAADFAIRILASSGSRRDRDNAAVVIGGSKADWDSHDRAEQPVIGKYITVFFPHRDWDGPAKRFRVDARPRIGRGETWPFEVRANTGESVEIRFEGIETVPEEYDVWLVDQALEVSQDLRRSARHVISKASEENPGRLLLIVGTKSYVDEEHESRGLLPERYVLESNFPNPFNPTTTIRFGIPRRERVTLRVYSVQGRRVASLLEGEPMEAGYHAVTWQGRSDGGRAVASGVYLYQLTAGSFRETRKMVLIR
ncbi:MAG: DUF11 domain-containing protein [Candidatus Eisenbacteria bacterium]|nr:DUF11 domain-containing protein [Candidatus Eisenbacteria bacterium]